jgi:transcriptional regulator with XRE-family HTH domain
MTPPIPRSFGANLREARREAGLTQQTLAERLGYQRPATICQWERDGAHLPEPETIVKLATAIGCKPAALLRDVITPYDALRGSTRPAPPASALSAEDEQWLAIGRAIGRGLRRSTVALLEETIRDSGGAPPSVVPVDARYRSRGSSERGARRPASRDAARRTHPRTTP